MKSCFAFAAILSVSTVISLSVSAKEIDKSGQTKVSNTRAEFCANSEDPNYFKSLAYSVDNTLYYGNRGGLMNGGVCWWHSMFTRNALNLAVFQPNKPRVSGQDALNVINDIVTAKGVVEIGGFRNLYEFSQSYGQDIQAALDAWQIGDGALMFGWVRGVSGETEVAPAELKSMMDDLYSQVKNKKQVVYQKLQIPGIADRKSTRLNSSHTDISRMPSSA